MAQALKKKRTIYKAEKFLPTVARLRVVGSDIEIPTSFSPEEYLEFERNAEERHEYIAGNIVKMAGESLAHSRICFNLGGVFYNQLVGKNCEGLSPNMKVRVTTKSLYAYPDLTIVCGEPQFHDDKKDVLINPTAIFEVLSPSTERYDRGDKFQYYRKETPSLQDYLLVSQNQVFIEQFTRQENGFWLQKDYESLEDVCRIDSIECEVSLREIYARVFTE